MRKRCGHEEREKIREIKKRKKIKRGGDRKEKRGKKKEKGRWKAIFTKGRKQRRMAARCQGLGKETARGKKGKP